MKSGDQILPKTLGFIDRQGGDHIANLVAKNSHQKSKTHPFLVPAKPILANHDRTQGAWPASLRVKINLFEGGVAYPWPTKLFNNSHQFTEIRQYFSCEAYIKKCNLTNLNEKQTLMYHIGFG